jgi:predicted permease
MIEAIAAFSLGHSLTLSLSVLAGAALLVRSLLAMSTAPLGFEPDGVLTARVQLPQSAYKTRELRAAFFRQLQERLSAIPGVQSVASVTQIPSATMSRNFLTIDGVVLSGDGPTFIPYMAVSDDYFTLMGIRLVRGRLFGAQDAAGGTPTIVISETMAKRYWPNGDAIGARVHISPHTSDVWGTVIGIVNDVRVDPATPTPTPMAYATNRQDYAWSGRDFLIRTTRDPLLLVQPARLALAALDPTLPLRDARGLREIVNERLASHRLPMLLMTAFGVLALLLSSVGVYAMFATMATAREREFGVRVALGSGRGAIALEVLRQGTVWMAIGIALGALGVSIVARALRDLLFGIAPLDPVALSTALGALLICGLVAVIPPVRRATRVDPIDVLR